MSKTQTKEESEQPRAEAASRLLIGTVMDVILSSDWSVAVYTEL